MPSQQDKPSHGDAGLQPERTAMAWERTTLTMVVAATVFLRWMPHHGLFVCTIVAASAVTALAINFGRKRRFRRAVQGINQEVLTPDVASTTAVAGSVFVLAGLGIFTVLFLPA